MSRRRGGRTRRLGFLYVATGLMVISLAVCADETQLHAALPDHPEATAFYALAHLATAPCNAISRAHSDRAAEMLLRVYASNPDHAGAMHYLVHANDVPGRERESLEITRKYDAGGTRARWRNPGACLLSAVSRTCE